MMTRKESIQKIDTLKTINDDGYSFEKEDIKDLVNEIHDDVESRLCKNCIHNNSCEMQYVLRQGVTNPPFLKDFGCSKFE